MNPTSEQLEQYRRFVLTEKIKVIRLIQQEQDCGLRAAKDLADQLYEEEDRKRTSIQKMNERLNQWAQKEIARVTS